MPPEHPPKLIDDAALEAGILQSLQRRDFKAPVCPSEIARSLADDESWRSLMPRIREILKRLIRQERVAATRGRRVLSAETLEGGPIRIRRGRRFG